MSNIRTHPTFLEDSMTKVIAPITAVFVLLVLTNIAGGPVTATNDNLNRDAGLTVQSGRNNCCSSSAIRGPAPTARPSSRLCRRLKASKLPVPR